MDDWQIKYMQIEWPPKATQCHNGKEASCSGSPAIMHLWYVTRGGTTWPELVLALKERRAVWLVGYEHRWPENSLPDEHTWLELYNELASQMA